MTTRDTDTTPAAAASKLSMNQNKKTYHRDGTVTLWSVIDERWVRGRPGRALLDTLSGSGLARVVAHCCDYDLDQTDPFSPVLTAYECGVALARQGRTIPGGATRAVWAGYYAANNANIVTTDGQS